MKQSIDVLINRDVGQACTSQHGVKSVGKACIGQVKVCTRQNASQNCHASTVMRYIAWSQQAGNTMHTVAQSTQHTATRGGIGGHRSQRHTTAISPGT